ncbi:hypothetical protein [Kitasatospora sp. NPDC057500]|uniref:hypothetical protein n=1 Tax=Kitasatospora sp. NPDC057500 TaxID=3346151 RepID=UPI003689208B
MRTTASCPTGRRTTTAAPAHTTAHQGAHPDEARRRTPAHQGAHPDEARRRTPAPHRLPLTPRT